MFITNPYKNILMEIEGGLWDHDVRVDEKKASPYEYDDETFRACIKIFMSSLMQRVYLDQNRLNTSLENRCVEIENVGNEFRKFIKDFTGVDTRKLYD